MKSKEINQSNKREPIRAAHQLVETNYLNREEFVNKAKNEIKRNFEAFVKNEKPDPKEYKAIGVDGVVFGDFPDQNFYNYNLAFDFQDWETSEQMTEDLESTLRNFFNLMDDKRVQPGIITVQLVHYM
ncbi:MAG: hypothetical protein RL365_1552 [Bacteroidota bacterium]|jgi:hypothetical protein